MITRKQLYKRLKEKKLFSKYCVTVASAFYKDQYSRTKKDDYEKGWLSERWTNVNDVKGWCNDMGKLLIIQQ